MLSEAGFEADARYDRPEADKLLDWIVSAKSTNLSSTSLETLILLLLQDVGVLDAVEKQYLKACVFAVYLVSIPDRQAALHRFDPLCQSTGPGRSHKVSLNPYNSVGDQLSHFHHLGPSVSSKLSPSTSTIPKLVTRVSGFLNSRSRILSTTCISEVLQAWRIVRIQLEALMG